MLRSVIFITLAIILVIILTALAVWFGLSGDEKMEAFLAAPGKAQQLKQQGIQHSSREDQVSPLVLRARDFALRINPPPPPPPPVARSARLTPKEGPPRPAGDVPVQFELMGTGYFPDKPEKSWALVNEVGKGMHWIKSGESIGHIKIEQIKDGSIVIKDGEKSSELVAKREIKPSTLTMTNVQAAAFSPSGLTSISVPGIVLTPIGVSPAAPVQPSMSPGDMQMQNIEPSQQISIEQAQEQTSYYDSTAEEQAVMPEDEKKALEDILLDLEKQKQTVSPEEAAALEEMAKMLRESLLEQQKLQQTDANVK